MKLSHKEKTHSKQMAESQVWTNPWHFLAFSCGLGTLPWVPGTWGTLGGVLIYLFIYHFSLWSYLSVLVITTGFGIWLCGKVAKDIGIYDYSGIVWDEVVGYLFTMTAVPFGWPWMVLGFVLFRVFDILKPWPICILDKHLKNGLGIMIDDIAAAIPAWVILQLLAKVV